MDWSGVDYLWIIVMFLSAVWTLILTAPIHCRASIAETLMECCVSPNLMKKQTHLHLGFCTQGEIWFVKCSFIKVLLNDLLLSSVFIISRIVEFHFNWSYFCNHQSIHVVRSCHGPSPDITGPSHRVSCVFWPLSVVTLSVSPLLYALLVRGAGCHGFDGIGGCFQLANPARCSPNPEMNALDARRSWPCIQSCTFTGPSTQ